jgi:hypothetical protein
MSELHHMDERRYIVEEPVGRVRWVERDGYRVLQQRWAVKEYDAKHNCIGVTGEWKDVPVEADEDYHPGDHP